MPRAFLVRKNRHHQQQVQQQQTAGAGRGREEGENLENSGDDQNSSSEMISSTPSSPQTDCRTRTSSLSSLSSSCSSSSGVASEMSGEVSTTRTHERAISPDVHTQHPKAFRSEGHYQSTMTSTPVALDARISVHHSQMDVQSPAYPQGRPISPLSCPGSPDSSHIDVDCSPPSSPACSPLCSPVTSSGKNLCL